MLTVAVLNQTVSRFWRWRERAFRARAVTWKEAAKALPTLAADDMWVRGGTKQKMVGGLGLSGLGGGREVRCSWFLESSHRRLQFGKDSGGWLSSHPSCLLPMC